MTRALAVITVILLTACSAFGASNEKGIDIVDWSSITQLSIMPGVNGAFAGVSNDVLILAGGMTSDTVFHDEIYIVSKHPDGSFAVKQVGKLKRPLAFGAVVSTDKGVVCLGGRNNLGVYADVSILKWNQQAGQIEQIALPGMPTACMDIGAAVLNDIIYVAGGRTNESQINGTNNFWSYDLRKPTEAKWQVIFPWPGEQRAKSLVLSQFNGKTDCIYIIGGQTSSDGNVRHLTDVFEFTPENYDPQYYNSGTNQYDADNAKNLPWRKCSGMPITTAGINGFNLGQSHIFAFGREMNEQDKTFDMTFLYHTITDTWVCGKKTAQHFESSTAIDWDGSMVVSASGPSVEIWKADPVSQDKPFGVINFSVIGIYLAVLVGVGVFFSFRQKSTDDYFRGGQRIPWFVAGCSIFATMLSSITFIAIPAKAFMTDWTFIVINFIIVVITPFIIFCILPFFRKLDAASAYEYLEKRFNLFCRLFASASFLLYQIGRMAIILYLTALPISIITPMSVQSCILLMGLLSIIYCTMGGLEAVAWTDTIQTFVLSGGAILCLILIFNDTGGASEVVSIAASADKFQMINLDFSALSYTKAVFWVIVIGGIGNALVPYTSDMAVIQRYMSVADDKQAKKAIWTNAVAVIPASIIFFGLGAALFAYYKTHPSQLDPSFPSDAIFPLFIARQLPVGISGLVVAGIFAAAQSTISTGMNSTSTAFVTDFVARFDLIKTDRGYLNLARVMTMTFGVLSTALGLLFATSNVKSMWETSMGIIGLLGGAMCGLFILGMFTRRASGIGAVIGALAGIVVVLSVKTFTPTHQLLYAGISIFTTVLVGYLASLIVPGKTKNIKGLTWFSPK